MDRVPESAVVYQELQRILVTYLGVGLKGMLWRVFLREDCGEFSMVDSGLTVPLIRERR